MDAYQHHPAVAGIRTVSQSGTDVTDSCRSVIEAYLFLMLLRGRRCLVGVVNSWAKTRPPWRGQLHDS